MKKPPRVPGLLLLGLVFFVSPQEGKAQVVTSVAGLRDLLSKEAAENRPVKIRGIITFCDGQQYGFIQDETGGTYFNPQQTAPGFQLPGLPAGTLVEITGKTVKGVFAPYIGEDIRIKILGTAPLPEPLFPERGRLLQPRFHSTRISLEAYVIDARFVTYHKYPHVLEMELIYGGRNIKTYIGGDWGSREMPPGLVHSDINVSGVYGSKFNSDNELAGVWLFVPSLDEIEILDENLGDAFSSWPRKASELMHFNRGRARRIRFSGDVLANVPGVGLFLRDESGAIRVEAVEDDNWQPGTAVDAVGFPVSRQGDSILEDAVVRADGNGPPPEPVPTVASEKGTEEMHADLVSIRAHVVDLLKRTDDTVIVLDAPESRFYARLISGEVDLPAGTAVEVSGICLALNQSEAAPFSLILRNPDDIRVLKKPSWWTTSRILGLLAVLALAVFTTLFWGFSLRRRVKSQTTIIARKFEDEQLAEERNRIARELHDTLEQELVGVSVQLDTAASRIAESPDRAAETLTRARAMLRHTQAEARRSVWDLRTESLTRGSLSTALQELIARLVETSEIEISFATEGESRTLPGPFENHLYRITQESIQNALKHAEAESIQVRLEYGEKETTLSVRDDGAGFDPHTAPNFRDGHFGLLGMQERAGKMNADLSIESKPGKGTRIQIRVPQS